APTRDRPHMSSGRSGSSSASGPPPKLTPKLGLPLAHWPEQDWSFTPSRASAAAELRLERIEQRKLARQHQFARFHKGHPARLIDFGEVRLATASRRPLDLELDAFDGRGIEIAFNRERLDDLAARLRA